jgi:hypothetical protein
VTESTEPQEPSERPQEPAGRIVWVKGYRRDRLGKDGIWRTTMVAGHFRVYPEPEP